MKKHFEQATAFDRDNPLNQRTGLGKKYNELVDEYNALEEKYNKAVGIVDEVEDIDDDKTADETVSDGATTDNQPSVDPADGTAETTETADEDTGKSHKGLASLFGKK